MMDFFLLSENSPFIIALGLMLAFTIVEIISASIGMGLSEMVDSTLPEFDANIDVDADNIGSGEGPGSLVKLLAWFRVGEVPVIMLFIVFLTGFGLSGLMTQYICVSLADKPLPALAAILPAVMASIPTVRVCGGLLGKYMPKDETYAVSEKSFYGMTATITLGTASAGKPAQAKLKDRHGQTHYILAEPDNPDDYFAQGDRIIIVSQTGAIFKVIRADNTALTN